MRDTPKDFILRRIKNCILNKLPDCRIMHDVVHRRIGYNASGVSTVYTDITEPLMALYQYFADIEDEHWREKLCEKFAVPMDMLYPKGIKLEGKYKFIMDKKPKVYISGPITGLSEKVYKNNFNSTELYLTGLGYDVINPVSYPTNPEWKWEDYMKRDIKLLCDCDYIYLLEGWQASDGASLEYVIAKNLGIKTLTLDDNGKVL